MKIQRAASYEVKIFIAGDYKLLAEESRNFCDEIGLCVTVTPTKYIYTNGEEDGSIIGLINYGRFPKSEKDVWNLAENLAKRLKVAANQTSFTIQDKNNSDFYSWRDYD